MERSSLQSAPSEVNPDHFVQFWSDSDLLLLDGQTQSAGAVGVGNAAVCVVTKIHTKALTRLFKRRGQDLTIATKQGRYITLDAAGCISAVMPEGKVRRNEAQLRCS